jgi:hypothetical protein
MLHKLQTIAKQIRSTKVQILRKNLLLIIQLVMKSLIKKERIVLMLIQQIRMQN